MRILIAEDEPTTRVLLQKLVEHLGHTVLLAGDGATALELFQKEQPDVILSDWMMPQMDGVELCKRVRASSPGKYTYFILVTALNDRNFALQGIEAGADDYLPKPIDREQLRLRLIVAARVTALYAKLLEQQEALAALNQRLLDEGRTDSLTRLGNRLRLREDLARLSEGVARYGYICAVMLCDVDHFKKYNDTAGHLAGDEVLRSLGASFLRNIRAGDAAYRYGGEEFLVLLPGQTILSAAVAAERHRRAVAELAIPHPGLASGALVSISVGVAALGRNERKSVEALLSEADQALYEAKRQGRNRVVAHGLPIGP